MSASDYPECAVCGRNMLRGERLNDYLDERRAEVVVCALCKPRAEAMGWTPAALAGAVELPAGSRRRLGFGGGLRERLGRRLEAERTARAQRGTEESVADAGPPPEPFEPVVPAARPEQPTAPEPDSELPPEPEPEPTPLEAFNASEEARKIAGLIRSLGQPQVTLRDDVITVAWELSWYQWRVAGWQVEQVGKGNEIAEIDAGDRLWNAAAAEDGTLSLD